MRFFSKPLIEKCEMQSIFICSGKLMRIRFTVTGWGALNVLSSEHPQWPGVKKKFFGASTVLTMLVPIDANISVKCSNIFGSYLKYYFTPNINPSLLLKETVRPESFKFTYTQYPFKVAESINFAPTKMAEINYSVRHDEIRVAKFTTQVAKQLCGKYLHQALPKLNIDREKLIPKFSEELIKL